MECLACACHFHERLPACARHPVYCRHPDKVPKDWKWSACHVDYAYMQALVKDYDHTKMTLFFRDNKRQRARKTRHTAKHDVPEMTFMITTTEAMDDPNTTPKKN